MNTLNTETIFTVSQLTASIKEILENQYRFIRICGEVSNLKTPFSGHCYFTLKDSGAQIRAVLFKQQKRFVDLALQDGQQVVVFGRISLYEPRGEYQIVADSIELYGIGKLLREFEQLKRKLAEKGYFAAESKKAIPPYPAKIVVITSPTGAAIHDFLKIVNNRRSPIHIQILPVKVQGASAAGEIARAIDLAQGITDTDIIVLCRGGGSIEDLWAFNEEIVAEAIHRSSIPVVTGIGHEVDFTIADFCADFRCPTPTGAAEKLVPNAEMLRNHLRSVHTSLRLRFERKIYFLDQQLLHHKKMLGDMKNVFSGLEFRLHLGKAHLMQAAQEFLQEKENACRIVTRRLQQEMPANRILLQEQHVSFLASQLKILMQRAIERKQASLAEQAGHLNGLSPLGTLARGYAIARKKESGDATWRVVSRARDTRVGEELNVLLQEGQLDCVVTRKSE